MINANDSDARRLLDAIGGEPLAGSGFEDETPESEFVNGEEGA